MRLLNAGALLAMGMVAVLSGCSGKVAPINPPTPLTELEPELRVEHRWVRQLGRGSHQYHLKLQPTADAERVFAANHDGRVEAFAGQKGERLWRVDLDTALNAGPVEGGELLLLGGMAEVIALHKADGSIAWRSPVGSEILARPAWHREVIVVHGGDGRIIGLDANSGEERWQHQESVPSLSLRGAGDPLIVGDEGVLVGTATGKLVALSLHEGALLWEVTIATPRGRTELERIADIDADMALADGVVYVSSYQGVLAAVALAGGQILWNRDIASSTGIIVDREHLYVTDTDGTVWALLRQSGATMWRQQAMQYRSLSAPIHQGSYLIVGDYDGYLHWLHKEDGRLAARTRIQDWREYWPIPDDMTRLDESRKVDRAVSVPPAVRGVRVFAQDKRGVLDVFEVTRVEAQGTE